LNSSTSAQPQPWLKFAALILVVAALGLPINDLFRYGLLVVATVLVVAGSVSTRLRPWLGAVAAVALCVLGQLWLKAPHIEEGHNVFIVDGAHGDALKAGLPADVFEAMRAELDAKYPPQRRCDPKAFGCWRGEGFPDRAFAFSSDAVYDRPLFSRQVFSRQVSGIDFVDPIWLRLGFINELGYNWISPPSDIERAVRDRRSLAVLHRWQLTMPWFVMYRFPADFVGSDLCWRGEVLWEGAGGQFGAISHSEMACRTLTADDVGRKIFGVAISSDLAMRLAPSVAVRARQLVEPTLALIGTIAVVALLVILRPRQIVLPFALIAVTLAVAFLNDASFIGGVRPFDGGDDGLVYEGFARAMLRQLMAGDVRGALGGGEPVFYFTPGMRYVLAVQHLVFGDTFLGYLALMLLLPFLALFVFQRFLPRTWALAAVTIFAAIPIGVLFGSSLVQYVKWAAKGFADPAAAAFFLGGLVLLCGDRERPLPYPPPLAGEREGGFGTAMAAGILFALALFARPNLAPGAGILLGGAGLAALWQGQYRRVVGLCLGFLPVLGMALHNWVYGGQLVLFTSTSRLAMLMPPAAYLAAFMEGVRGDFAGEHVARAVEHIGAWLAGPSELTMLAPLQAAALVVLVRVALWRAADPWLRLIALATLVQHSVALFFVITGRYHYVTWLLTLVVVIAWLHGEGLAILCKRWPHFCERVAAHPARLALARGLDRMAQMA
jgi:hypothetical protein